MATPCLCGSGLDFPQCCGGCLDGSRPAPSPEALMRSRYCAFVLGDADYLLASWLNPPLSRTELVAGFGDTQWTRLAILAAPRPTQDRGEVEFVAFFQQDGQRFGQLHERSRFARQDGQWYYVDGNILPPLKVGRNEPCPCGSGQKRKICHPE